MPNQLMVGVLEKTEPLAAAMTCPRSLPAPGDPVAHLRRVVVRGGRAAQQRRQRRRS